MKQLFLIIILFVSLSNTFAQEPTLTSMTDSLSKNKTRIVCRGTTLPQDVVYVIDGVLSNADSLKKIKPEDIVSVNLLKNAIGMETFCRSNNGVIIVRTKNSLTKRELRKQKRKNKD